MVAVVAVVVAGYIINLSRLDSSGHLSHSASQPGLLTLSQREGEGEYESFYIRSPQSSVKLGVC